MKAINKNIITAIIIVFAGLFLTTCDSCKPDTKPLLYWYIPDSLKFPMQTGDTAIFLVRNDSIRYDTAVIKVDSSMDAFLDPSFNLAGYRQSISITYSFNDEKESRLVIIEERQPTIMNTRIYIYFEYWNKNFNDYICNVINITNTVFFDNILIQNKNYSNVAYTEVCGVFFTDIYRNIEDGLISFTNVSRQDTFNLFKYLPIN